MYNQRNFEGEMNKEHRNNIEKEFSIMVTIINS